MEGRCDMSNKQLVKVDSVSTDNVSVYHYGTEDEIKNHKARTFVEYNLDYEKAYVNKNNNIIFHASQKVPIMYTKHGDVIRVMSTTMINMKGKSEDHVKEYGLAKREVVATNDDQLAGLSREA
jgi:hypothetical protein